jgi:hypothetical protein
MVLPNKTPTESAEHYFDKAYQLAIASVQKTATANDATSIAIYNMAACMSAIAKGMADTAVGLRATYVLLERLDRKLDRLPPR